MVMVFFTLTIVVILVMAALVIDVGNARQQHREAVAAADAAALAGGQALAAASQTPAGCPDASCTAAYYTLASADSTPGSVSAMVSARSACQFDPVAAGETCWRYTSGKATVEVKNPYLVGGTVDAGAVHVKVCWASPAPFARIFGTTAMNVCGSATARNSAFGGRSGGAPGATPDCAGEDNFADANDNPTIYVFNPGDYPDVGGTLNFSKGNATSKNNQVLAVLFSGVDSDLDPASVTFLAPTTVSGPNGQTVQLPLITPSDNHGPKSPSAHGIGYTIQTLDSTGKLRNYTPGGTYQVVIAYQLPDDSHLKVNGQSFIYTATLHAADIDQSPGPDCGNASWTFTHDGKGVTSATSCGENSFLAYGVFPSSGHAKPGDPVGAYYTDESPLQTKDVTDPYWTTQTVNAGIDFEISGGKFTASDGSAYQIPKSATPAVKTSTDGYTLTPLPAGVTSKEAYGTTIQYILPPVNDPRWENSVTYTVFLKSYDTDNNKPGNDCGLASWSFVLSGALASGVRLIE